MLFIYFLNKFIRTLACFPTAHTSSYTIYTSIKVTLTREFPSSFEESSSPTWVFRFRTHSNWVIRGTGSSVYTMQSSASQSSPIIITPNRKIWCITFCGTWNILINFRTWSVRLVRTLRISPRTHTSTCWALNGFTLYRSSITSKNSTTTAMDCDFISF